MESLTEQYNSTDEYYYYYYYYDYENEDDAVKGDQLKNSLFSYIAPVLILIGTVGNVMTLAVLQSKAFRPTPSSFILSALAVVDIAVLNTGLLRQWILALTDSELDVRTLSPASCNIHVFLTYMCSQLSAWTLVLMTAERLFSVVTPVFARLQKKQIKSWMVILWVVLLLVFTAINSHFFITVQLYQHPNLPTDASNETEALCYYTNEHFDFMVKIWPIIDSLLMSVIPGFIILVANMLIVILRCRITVPNKSDANLRAHRAHDSQSRSITVMLLSISALFILSTTPVAVYLIGYGSWPSVTPKDKYNRSVAFTAVNLIFYSNYTLNFILYCVSGSKFRQALVLLCHRKKKSPENSSFWLSSSMRHTAQTRVVENARYSISSVKGNCVTV